MGAHGSEPITLRGHTLLCLQGFRGEGYDAPFIECLTAVHGDLLSHPDCPVRVVQEPDALCEACPNLEDDECRLNGSGSEAEMRTQDADVLSRLGIETEGILPWQEILNRIGQKISGSDLVAICGSCRWLSLGYCREGIDVLNKGIHS
ncbi:MAG: DUF1284 domain-containing protein [Nitrospiria bacterium]